MMTNIKKFKAILFDLDGTLLDTAPDLAFALNQLRTMHGEPNLPFEMIRPAASHGSKGLLKLGFGITETEPDFELFKKQFLTIYYDNIAHKTCPFPGILEVLQYLEQQNLFWGIVTNKPAHLTETLIKKLQLFPSKNCLVSGDTLPQSKPHPAPLLHASNLLECKAAECVYIGDAERDIIAGNRAGMHTLIALYGYLGAHDQPQTWQAHGTITFPLDLIPWLEQ